MDVMDVAEREAGHGPLIGALMRMPLDAVRTRMLADLAGAGFADVIPAHFAVLRFPGPDGKHPSELADEAGTTRQAMNYLLGELEAMGYLRRAPDPGDGRSKLVFLTERGRAVKETLRAVVGQIEGELAAQMGLAEFGQLRELLVRLNACDFTGGRGASGG